MKVSVRIALIVGLLYVATSLPALCEPQFAAQSQQTQSDDR